MNKTAKTAFITAIKFVNRPNTDKLLAELEKSDFFTAPATANDHDSVTGGLLAHSLCVQNKLRELVFTAHPNMTEEEATQMLESIIVVSLLHGVGLINTYKPYQKNVKDEAGNWVTMAAYRKEPDMILPGTPETKSLLLLQQWGYPLTMEEAIAITSVINRDCNANDVYKEHPLAFYLHMADEMAVFQPEMFAGASATEQTAPVQQTTPAYVPNMTQLPMQQAIPAQLQYAPVQQMPQQPAQQPTQGFYGNAADYYGGYQQNAVNGVPVPTQQGRYK